MKSYVGPYNSFREITTPLFPTPTATILDITKVSIYYTQLSTVPFFFYTIPYLEHEMSVCRTRNQAPIQPKTATNSVTKPTVFYLLNSMELCMLMDSYNAIGQAVEVVMTSFSVVYSSYQRKKNHISSSGRKS